MNAACRFRFYGPFYSRKMLDCISIKNTHSVLLTLIAYDWGNFLGAISNVVMVKKETRPAPFS